MRNLMRHWTTIAAVLLPTVLFAPNVFASSSCAVAFLNTHRAEAADHVTQATQKMISYLETLLERQTLGDEGLQRMLIGLESGKIVNPFREGEGRVDIASLIHRDGFEKITQEGEINQAVFLQFVRERLSRREAVKIQRARVEDEILVAHLMMQFHYVSGGKFRWVDKRGEARSEVIEPFELMDTPVTQAQWFKVMKENPARFNNGSEAVAVRRKKGIVHLLPDHPIENVTVWSVFVFANRLSELHGLNPVYDLSAVKWKAGTRAENGTLIAKSGKLTLNSRSLKPGYRIPTQIEQGFMLRRKPNVQLNAKAWFRGNSDLTTHPVAEKDPIFADGNDFYDLFGNVDEMTLLGHGPYKLKKGKEISWKILSARGGSFLSEREECSWECGPGLVSHFSSSTMGFRLARDAAD